jgi:hypothetical protein
MDDHEIGGKTMRAELEQLEAQLEYLNNERKKILDKMAEVSFWIRWRKVLIPVGIMLIFGALVAMSGCLAIP